MKKIILNTLLAASLILPAFSQTNVPTFINGGMNMRFNTRTQPASGGGLKIGEADKYDLNINVSNSAIFRGTVEAKPFIDGTFSVAQQGLLTYTLDCDVVNPNNPAQTRNIGKLYGTIPVDKNNVYRFQDGNLRFGIFALGNAKGFESKFAGLALGKPPVVKDGFFAKMKRDALSFSKQVNGKTVVIVVNNYDKMEFQNFVLGAGPVQIYPDTTVNGSMIYDYARSAWYFKDIAVVYALNGRQFQDKISGNIRWVESPNRKTNGEGEYQFDIRVNELVANESAVFAAATDESAFFTTDDVAQSLTGTMKYKDVISGSTVVSSTVSIALVGNKLSKQQTMYLCKLILLGAIVPLNAE